MNEEILAQIRARFSSTTKPGPWKIVETGELVRYTANGTSFIAKTQEDCIVDATGHEVLGASEYLNVQRSDLEFMAKAWQDIKFLLELVEDLRK
ncbi:MAG: hypothetical protein EPN91_02405 [Salinibacterium sp.]|nr:MAG: hypothetical protein EPN91_02405 [Salinibacterium sp.]